MDQKAFVVIFVVIMVVATIAVVVTNLSKGSDASMRARDTESIVSDIADDQKSTDEINFSKLGVPTTNPQKPVANQQGMVAQPTATPMRQMPQKRLFSSFPGASQKELLENKQIVIQTDKGEIVFEIYPEAPKAASNFIFLAQNEFYNGLIFHRVEPGFVIQGGDPLGNGTGGPGYTFEDEPVKRDYDKGIVAMANSGPNTNGSQFFIMLEDNPSLPKLYTIFGKVIKGMDVVSKITKGDVMNKVTVQDTPK